MTAKYCVNSATSVDTFSNYDYSLHLFGSADGSHSCGGYVYIFSALYRIEISLVNQLEYSAHDGMKILMVTASDFLLNECF